MCGIAGIINLSGQEASVEQVKSMLHRIRHRGPDGEGIHIGPGWVIGHRRLSIIDLSDDGKQPMIRNGLVLSFNGEIYNYIEIREELRSLGHRFVTHTDSEVLLAAYEQWGAQCTSRFNGMWAFVIYDPARNVLFCSRDRFGKKPFYYAFDKNRFVFCSELKGILESGLKPVADLSTVVQYLVLNMVETSDRTFFKDVRKLPAGHSGELDLLTGRFVVERYHDIRFLKQVNELDEASTVENYLQEFHRSITWRLRSDVKVATSLSGGLDSSFIAAVASKKYHQQADGAFSAITASSVDPSIDESHYAKMVADHCKLNWIVTRPPTETFLSVFDDVIWTQEEPFHSTSMVMQYFVMKAAHEAGIVVMLDGQGADETMLGYYNHITNYLRHAPLWQKPATFRNIVRNYGIDPKLLVQLYFYFSNSSLRAKRQQLKWANVKKEFLGDFLDLNVIRELSRRSRGPFFDFQKWEIQVEALPKLLRYEDKNSMRFSIETRLPFLDYQLVDIALSCNDKFKIKDGWSKYIIRKAMEPLLPAEITWRRKKIGFVGPDSEWLSDKQFFHARIRNSRILDRLMSKVVMPVHDNAMLWRMACLASWESTFGVEVD